MTITFPHLNLTDWQPTRDTLHIYSKLLGKIRGALTPRQPHWWHISLPINARGLTTANIPADEEGLKCFTLTLNLINHTLDITSTHFSPQHISLQNQSPQSLYTWTLQTLADNGIKPEIDESLFSETAVHPYDTTHATAYLTALNSIHQVFALFRASLVGETSPLQLWSHHFDVSFVWFSGREADVPEGSEGGPEQIGFGFSTGDEGIPEAYFYANPWPVPDGVANSELPAGASWHTSGWTGGVLYYKTLTEVENPEQLLFNYLTAVQRNSAALMT